MSLSLRNTPTLHSATPLPPQASSASSSFTPSSLPLRRTMSTESVSWQHQQSHPTQCSPVAGSASYPSVPPDCAISLLPCSSSAAAPPLRSQCTCKHSSPPSRRPAYLPPSAVVASHCHCALRCLLLALFAFCLVVTVRHFTMGPPHAAYSLHPHPTPPAPPAAAAHAPPHLASSLPQFTVPDPPFRNYTVPPLLAGRWPPPLPSRPWTQQPDDPFTRHSPGRFATTRGAVLSLYTPNQYDWLAANFAVNCRNLLSAMADHSDWIIYYTLYPHDASEQLHALLAAHNSTLITDPAAAAPVHPSSDLHGRLRALDYPLTLAGVREYLTADGVHVITVPVVVNLPAYLERDAGRLLDGGFNYCWGIKWEVEYSLLSGAVFPQQLFLHPILAGYDYFVKLDMDIQIVRPLPAGPSLFHRMASQQCAVMHTTYRSRSEDCGLNAPEAVAAWADAAFDARPASGLQGWWGGLDYYWGNFMGGWLGWMKSAENAALSAFLYGDQQWSGYFSRRWTDQPVVIHMVGMWYNLTDAQVRGVPMDGGQGVVCDYSALRDEHVKHKYREGQPLPVE